MQPQYRNALHNVTQWSVRLSVRTPGFHPGKGGSIPPRTTKNIENTVPLNKEFWSVRLSVRTPGFHPGKGGSIPPRTTS